MSSTNAAGPTKQEIEAVFTRLRAQPANKVSSRSGPVVLFVLCVLILFTLLFLSVVLFRLCHKGAYLVVRDVRHLYMHRLLGCAPKSGRAPDLCAEHQPGYELDLAAAAPDAVGR